MNYTSFIPQRTSSLQTLILKKDGRKRIERKCCLSFSLFLIVIMNDKVLADQ